MSVPQSTRPSVPPADRRARPAWPRLLVPFLGRVPGVRRRPPEEGSTTAHDLAVRHRLLLGLSALLTLSLLVSYEGVHGDARPLRTSSAPAVLAIDTARYALGEAEKDAGATTSTSEFSKQIAVAAQSLAAAAADDVGAAAGRQAVQTITGLITVYAGMVEKAQLHAADGVLRKAYLSYASSVLRAPGSGIQDRLTDLRRQQRAAVHRQTSFGPLLWLCWSATALLALALVVALVETQLFLRRRFRRKYNPFILSAVLLLTVGCTTLALFTFWTHRGMAHTRRELDRPLTGPGIRTAGQRTASYLADTGFHAAATVWIVIGGLLLMALARTGLQRHITDYRFRPR
ncbi:hypothetical protein [Streptomyces sp. NK08204]|uniref:hypothetical protein n=1 Tax=Streptomyces sp. NK08204 TaxID=2873260 RepID=UPI001CED11BA|nr:hypothetical protein [Streptomyces sp. NK08204]